MTGNDHYRQFYDIISLLTKSKSIIFTKGMSLLARGSKGNWKFPLPLEPLANNASLFTAYLVNIFIGSVCSSSIACTYCDLRSRTSIECFWIRCFKHSNHCGKFVNKTWICSTRASSSGELIYTRKMIQPGIFSRVSQPVYFFRL